MARVSLEEIQISDGKRRKRKKRKGHLAIKSDCHYPDGAVSTRVGCFMLDSSLPL